MSDITLYTIDGHVLYTGQHPTIAHAVTYALLNNIRINGIDLHDTDLRHINLDGVTLENASFNGADLSGANMSEADFKNCDFSGARLTDVCFCYSNIIDCNFRYSLFSDTDISMSCLESCSFEGLKSLYLDFHTAFKLESLTYYHGSETISFSRPPVIVKAGNQSSFILSNILIYNDRQHTFGTTYTPESMVKSTQKVLQFMVDCEKEVI